MAKNMTRRAFPRGGIRTRLPVTIYRRSSNQLNADAQDWINRVYSNGGTVSSATAGAVNTFCNDIDAAGIRDRFFRMGIFCGSNLNAALVPLYRGPSLGGTQYGNTTDTNNAFVGVGTDYAETGATGGLTGNGTSKWLRTGLTTEAIPDISTGHLSAYASVVTETSVIDAMISAWAPGYGNPVYALEWNRASNGALMHMWGGSFAGPSVTAASGAGVGFLMSSRTSNTDLRLYKNGSQIGSTSTTDVTPVANAGLGFGVFCNLTSSGATPTPDNIFAGRLASYSVGLGMTAAQAAAYNTAMQSFQAALTRNV